MELETYAPFQIEPLGDKPAGRVLKEGVEALETAGIHYWLTSGTMLGIYRDGELIKVDTDLDVGVVGEDPKVIVEIMNDEGFVLVQSLDHDNFPQQRAFIKENIIFDVYFYYPHNGCYVNINAHGWIRIPMEMFKDGHRVSFEGKLYSCPDPAVYLKWHYGDWETPNRNSDDWSGMQRSHENSPDLRNI